jgi:tetratricopeptide (TPR) repeat protein
VAKRLRRILLVAGLAMGAGLAAIAAALFVTWPDNALGDHLQIHRNQAANVRGLQRLGATAGEPLVRAFYQAWLAEEAGHLPDAIRRFQAVADAAPPGSRLRCDALLRLGLAYGQDGQADRELATYRELMEQYPGQSRLSQAMFHLRRGERAHARTLLDEALTRDAQDGSLGADRSLAVQLHQGLRAGEAKAAGSP